MHKNKLRWLGKLALGVGVISSMAFGIHTYSSASGRAYHSSTDVKSEVKAYGTQDFTAFETGPVRPIALSENKEVLFSVNTPNGQLEVFNVEGERLNHKYSVPVGMEPVSVAVRNDNEVWVVNHLSDSVSIVSITENYGYVKQTLLVGDEPRDIVFAGEANKRAFITVAHRGQNAPFDPQLETPGIGRADVWVYETASVENKNPQPLSIVNMFSDTPRALAVSPDGEYVYAAAFHSGNKTTVLKAELMKGGLDKPTPVADIIDTPQPITGLIVKHNGEEWVDHGDPRNGIEPQVWSDRVKFNLPDKDVFIIDATAKVPEVIKEISGVGTTLFNMAVNPSSGKVYVSNTDSLNHIRFSTDVEYGENLRGHFIKNQISVLDGDKVTKRDLNNHIESYGKAHGTEEEKRDSLAIPLQMVVSDDGEKLYVAAYGSQAVGVIDVKDFERGDFKPNRDNYIETTGGGPAGLLLNEDAGQLYVYTRFDNAVSVVNLNTKKEVDKQKMQNPEPKSLVAGRKFLYDARLGSSRGDIACASCHVFGDSDQLSWDLGDPMGISVKNPNPYFDIGRIEEKRPFFHPMKGPMFTQSLRGLSGNGPMHWRGDRTGVTREEDESIEEQAFEDFNKAFIELHGKREKLSEEDMQRFAEFALQLTYPPNPIRRLDNTLTADQHDADQIFNSGSDEKVVDCNTCHKMDPVNKNYGTEGLTVLSERVNGRFEDFKVPHLRALYQKVGMFGDTGEARNGRKHIGDQIRGFGFNHDGSNGSIYQLLSEEIFILSEDMKGKMASLTFTLNGELMPIVGQQVTLNNSNLDNKDVMARLDLMMGRAKVEKPVPECDLVVQGMIEGNAVSAVYDGENFVLNKSRSKSSTIDELLDKADEQKSALTFTCVAPNNGFRAAFG